MNILCNQEKLIQSLIAVLAQDAASVQIFETHISWVLVTENFAYKFKKAARFDFLDFSTLEARHFFCQEELRLNRPLAPELYLDVLAITGDLTHPVINGTGAPIEYVVKMRAFSQQALWSYRIGKGELSTGEIDDLARKLAKLHQDAAIAPIESRWGVHDALVKTADENLAELAALTAHGKEKSNIDAIRLWQIAAHQRLNNIFDNRKLQGFVRQCHGDLHSANILTLKGQVTLFDCIEFSERLRWIDLMNDLAFICMELQCHGLPAFATRLLNGYLERTGDYAGVAVLPYFQVQRALVRCKVSLLRGRQLVADERAAAVCEQQAAKYLAYALQAINPRQAAIIIMHGYSGSGKSVISGRLLEQAGAVRIRSDVERKRMLGPDASAPACVNVGAGLYDLEATEATYGRLHRLALAIMEAGMPVIVDATFLKLAHRNRFQNLASGLGVPFFIIDIHAGEALLRARIIQRAQLGNDPSDAGLEVLDHQLAQHDALTDDERKHALCIDSEAGISPDQVRQACAPVLAALRIPSTNG